MFYSKGENRRKRWYHMLSIGRKKLLLLGCVFAAFFLFLLGVVIVYTVRASNYDLELVVRPVRNGMLYDFRNEPVESLDARTSVPVSYDDLPPNLINAFLAREDEHFFDHSGVVYSAVIRSVLRNVVSFSYEQGASTISMQLTRNVYDLQDKTMDRKLLEVFLARRIEKKYDKKTILTQYLNRIYYGQGCYGIGAAAQYYFGKKVQELNLSECATLAGLVRGPSLFNPVDDMQEAVKVRNETLARMLKLEFISQEEYDEVSGSPICLADIKAGEAGESSYTTMWARRELDALREDLGDAADGASVVSSLCIDVQQKLEAAVEQALLAVEVKGYFPEEEWKDLLPEDEAQAKSAREEMTKPTRPDRKDFKARDGSNDPKDLTQCLQCCVLVVDMRRGSQGNVLAVVSGRSVADGLDRWQGKIEPGRAADPLVFCSACYKDEHIVDADAGKTGAKVGYESVYAFISGLKLEADLPSKEEQGKLYCGLYPMRRLDLARVLFRLFNQGRGYKVSMVRSVWNRANNPVYVWEQTKAPEYIRREAAASVINKRPFISTEGSPTVISETLPDNYGCWTMVGNTNGVAVFVWMGFDDPAHPAASSPVLTKLIKKSSLYLAREMHAFTRAFLKEVSKKKSASK